MEPYEVLRARLAGQQLREPRAATAEEAVKNLLAVQAQEFPYARWSLAQRTGGATAADVEQALADGRILRTHILRPTWHFVHRDDLPWLRALSAPRLHQMNGGTYRSTGIDDEAASRSADVLAEAVAGGVHLTREQLAARLQGAGFAAKGLALAYLIMHAEISGVLVSGAPVRSPGGALRQTYAAFDERVAGAAPAAVPSREESLAALALRYFGSRGPATVRDCADWSGLTMTDVRRGLALAEEIAPGAIVAASFDGSDFYLRPSDYAGETLGHSGGSGRGLEPQRAGNLRPQIDLVQCYDEYIMGYSVSRHYFGGTAPAYPFGDTPMHVVLADGVLAGSWRHSLVRRGSAAQRCKLDIRLSRPLGPAAEQALAVAVADYGDFLEMPTVRIPAGS
ncbi:winged helix DNA-binding domain-containing protein [Arthrobacter globiformis]|uniref:Winged helix DNA-binding domain-containing protein n=1 Tax=Arthrobacter globiformis TaxID=1665 RepID=A0A328HDN8_ARTGO|nr:winged helix DNA-binding domain-containing protein [Arthrobacter globiformis]RAM36677.1 winged helix DNA-binding domain-containing protein [Arthrobacter globiformis]